MVGKTAVELLGVWAVKFKYGCWRVETRPAGGGGFVTVVTRAGDLYRETKCKSIEEAIAAHAHGTHIARDRSPVPNGVYGLTPPPIPTSRFTSARLRARSGATITACLLEARELARRMVGPVAFSLDGISVEVEPESSITELQAKWEGTRRCLSEPRRNK